MKLLLEISYIGSAFHGWQVQPGARTVQSCIQDACEKIFEHRFPVTGCSRTDSGVHAGRFFCTVEGDISLPQEKCVRAFNANLPDDVSVKKALFVCDDFHPRYSCLGKEYTYDIFTGSVKDPFSLGRSWMLCRKPDLKKMEQACSHIIGKRDFAPFCSAGSGVEDTVREVFDLSVSQCGEHIKVKVSANGFLYNMVRIIVGTLCDIGLGKYGAERIDDAFINKDRSLIGPTAPACGLYLTNVFYEKDIIDFFNER